MTGKERKGEEAKERQREEAMIVLQVDGRTGEGEDGNTHSPGTGRERRREGRTGQVREKGNTTNSPGMHRSPLPATVSEFVIGSVMSSRVRTRNTLYFSGSLMYTWPSAGDTAIW